MKKFLISLFTIIIFSLTTLYFYNESYFYKQLVWISLGGIILFVSKYFKINIFFKYSKYIYYINIFLLILVLLIGKSINGARAWFSFGFISFQPSELMKLSLALYLSEIFNKKEKYYLIYSLFVFIFPCVLVFIEPDTGAIIMYLVIYLAILFFCLKNKKIFYLLAGLGIISILLFIYFYKTNIDLLLKLFGTKIFYRIDRIINFKNNYQLDNALISMGSSNFIGRNNKMIYIPESVTDFIFARIVSLYGIFSGIVILVCYGIIFFELIKFVKNNKAGIFSFAFVMLFLFQFTQNIFMNIGLVPIMGISLPFLSYGGSNTIIYFLFLCFIVQNKKDFSFEKP